MKRMALGLSMVVLLVGSVAAAQEPRPAASPETRADAEVRAGRSFDRLDLNHDGKIDQADQAMRVNETFDRLDANHDGSISRAEFAAADNPPPGDDHIGHRGDDRHEFGGPEATVLLRADPGHTGTVTRAAFVAAALARFDEADTNHDGILTPQEHRAAAARMRMGQPGGWHDGADGGMPPPPDAWPPPESADN